MRILITNDDGIHSRGLAVLVLAARKMAGPTADIVVVAPSGECSGASQRITLGNLTVHRLTPADMIHDPGEPVADAVFAVEGFPADCVRLALAHGGPMHRRRQAGMIAGRSNGLRATDGPADEWLPDLVLSGINNGANIGHDLRYSGTVGAATEAACFGIPAIAFSRYRIGADLIGTLAQPMADYVGDLLKTWVADGTIAPGVFQPGRLVPLLSVNFPGCPPHQFKGIKITRQAGYFYDEAFEHIGRDPETTGEFIALRHETPAFVVPGDVPTDQETLRAGYVAVTPLEIELTRRAAIADLARAAKNWPTPPPA